MAGNLPARMLGPLRRALGLRVFRFFARRLGAAGMPTAPSGLTTRVLSDAQVAALCRDSELDLRENAAKAAFARGDLCIGAYDGSVVAGYCWVAFAPLHHLDGVWVEFGNRIAWTYKSLVREQYRGRGVAALLYGAPDDACRARGRGESLICVESRNTASVRAAYRAGYADAGWAGYLRRPVFLQWRSPGLRKRQVHFFFPAAA